MKKIRSTIEGKIAQPLLLWFLGVPGGLCLVLWLLFWRGK